MTDEERLIKARDYQRTRRANRTPEEHELAKQTFRDWFHANKDNPSFKKRRVRQRKEYHKRNRIGINSKTVLSVAVARKAAIDYLGGKCPCGFEDIRALQIDHIHGDGFLDKRTKSHGGSYYRKIVKDPKARDRYQILCANCNWIKRYENAEHNHITRVNAVTNILKGN